MESLNKPWCATKSKRQTWQAAATASNFFPIKRDFVGFKLPSHPRRVSTDWLPCTGVGQRAAVAANSIRQQNSLNVSVPPWTGASTPHATTCLRVGGCRNQSLVANKQTSKTRRSLGRQKLRHQSRSQEGRKKIFGLWKQALDSLKLDINSIYTNVVQTIKFGHSLSVFRTHQSDCKSYRIQKMLQINTAVHGWEEPQTNSGLPSSIPIPPPHSLSILMRNSCPDPVPVSDFCWPKSCPAALTTDDGSPFLP